MLNTWKQMKKNPRHFSYWAEEFEAEGATEVEVKRSTNDRGKSWQFLHILMGNKNIHFGCGKSDYTGMVKRKGWRDTFKRRGTTTSTKEDWQDHKS